MWKLDLLSRYADQGVLRTAEKGEELYAEVMRGLPKQDPGVPVALDFTGIRAVTVPFADASVCRVLAGWLHGYHDEHPLMIYGADEDVRETLAAALRNRHLVALALEGSNGGPELLGGDQVLRETVEQAKELGEEFTVAELADRLNLSAPATNNRLRALYRSGVVARKLIVPPGGGKEFVYRFPLSD
jgi:DNA-binding transcriptional ArsR family regulator